MSGWLESLQFWHWLILALVLLGAETLVPGAFLLWFGVAAALTGGLLYLVPSMAPGAQLIVFGVLSVVCVVGYLRFRHSHPVEDSDQPLLNKRAEQLVGRTLVLQSPIVNGRGRVKIGDAFWTVEGDEMPHGAKVQITGTDGLVLKVRMISFPEV